MVMRLLITLGVAVYFAYQLYWLHAIWAHGMLWNVPIWYHIRPLMIFLCYVYAMREGSRWTMYLAIWAGTGIFHTIIDLPWSAEHARITAIHLSIIIPAVIYWKNDPSRHYYFPRMLDRIRAWTLPAPNLEVIALGTPIDEVYQRYKLIKESDEASLAGCKQYEFSVGDQDIMLDVDEGEVVGVAYDPATYGDTEAQRLRNLKFYLQEHSRESKLKYLVNNGFGFLYRSRDDQTRASYSYAYGIFSVSRQKYGMVHHSPDEDWAS